ncbi:hypothetical protein KAU33_12905 [Candidatus Dependentiae bacterium]|nr:hypothetical protein [Candidatus Dependentiae bacterium]
MKNNFKKYLLVLCFLFTLYIIYLQIQTSNDLIHIAKYLNKNKSLYLLNNHSTVRDLNLLIINHWAAFKGERYPKNVSDIINHFKIEDKNIFKSNFRKIYFKFLINTKNDKDPFNDEIIIYDPDSIFVFENYYICYICSTNKGWDWENIRNRNKNIYNYPKYFHIKKALFHINFYLKLNKKNIIFYFKKYLKYFFLIIVFFSLVYWIIIYFEEKNYKDNL